MSKLENPVKLGIIGAAHGIKGEVRVKTFTADPLGLAEYGPLQAGDGRLFEIQSIRPQATVVVVRFKGVADRNAAEALNGIELFVDRSALPEDLEDEEFYHADLVGLKVRDTVGDVVGKVGAVLNFGGGDILEVKMDDGDDALIPFTKAAVPQVAMTEGYVVIDPVAAGLVTGDDELSEHHMDEGGGFDPKRRPRGPRGAGGNR